MRTSPESLMIQVIMLQSRMDLIKSQMESIQMEIDLLQRLVFKHETDKA